MTNVRQADTRRNMGWSFRRRRWRGYEWFSQSGAVRCPPLLARSRLFALLRRVLAEVAELNRGRTRARRKEVEEQVPALVSVLESDADARPEGFFPSPSPRSIAATICFILLVFDMAVTLFFGLATPGRRGSRNGVRNFGKTVAAASACSFGVGPSESRRSRALPPRRWHGLYRQPRSARLL